MTTFEARLHAKVKLSGNGWTSYGRGRLCFLNKLKRYIQMRAIPADFISPPMRSMARC
jgi:hypothetical protein